MTDIRNLSNPTHSLATPAEKITSAATPAPPALSPPHLQAIQALSTQLRQNLLGAVAQTGTITLFTGTDNAAKYAAAQTLASNLNRDLHRVDLGALVSKYAGNTGSALTQIFQSAASGAILFFDEADALFDKRTSVQDSHDKYANQSTGAPDDGSNLLQLLRQYPGIVILAVNSTDGCNPALLAHVHTTLKFPPNS